MSGQLYYGDNLDILRMYIPDESVDLVYLDPPFNSNRAYNMLFAEQDGTRAAAQVRAFGDTWRWDTAAARAHEDVVLAGGKPSDALQAFRQLMGDSDMLAYLSMMAPRLIELRRVLKPTGSLYLHCDPTASHYLRVLMDAIFGPANILGEIAWRRTASHVTARRWGRVHDVLLAYAADADRVVFNPPRVAADVGWVGREYRHQDERGQYSLADLTAAGTRNGPSGEPWKGIDPGLVGAGRHWRYLPDTLERLDADGRIYWPTRGVYPKLKQYLSDMAGRPVGDVWDDIPVLGRTAAERLGYPTQKPLALLERIIAASSNENGTVLDPFCGCGTTIDAAQRLKRNWIGIDITHLAIGLVKQRLRDAYGPSFQLPVVIGEPTTVRDAARLAADDPYQFQIWSLGLVGARPTEVKKGADRGIDGRMFFHDRPDAKKPRQIVFSVKAGGVNVAHLRDLRGVVDREKAEIGVLICMEAPTRAMEKEAASGGFYTSPWGSHPKLQILTVGELLEGGRIDYPASGMRQANVTVKKMPQAKATGENLVLPGIPAPAKRR